MRKIAVIGIGQSMRGDDGAGLEAVRQWQMKFPETTSRLDVSVEASELCGLDLLEKLCDTESVILVDAVHSGRSPGAIHHLSETDLASFMTDSKSAHGWGVAETLRMGRQLGEVNSFIRILGIEAGHFEIGHELSNAIQAAMPAICDAIEYEVNQLA